MKSTDESELRRRYGAQFINDAAVDILKKPSKSREDFYAFTIQRQLAIQSWIKATFGIHPLSVEQEIVGDQIADEEIFLTDEDV